jgi:hypothetical protein
MVAVIEMDWQDILDGKPFPESPARQLFTNTVISVAAQAKAALPQANGRVDRARDLVLGGLVSRNADSTFTVHSQSERGKSYVVSEGVCSCPDAQKGESTCKHLISTWLWRKAHKAIEEQLANDAMEQQPAETPKAELPIPSQFIVELHGKQFVTFSGLLTLAHERGLVSLKADFLSVTAEIALAHAVAMYRKISATRQCGSIGTGGYDASMKCCLSSSGCESRPAKGEPARAGSQPCDGARNGLGDA